MPTGEDTRVNDLANLNLFRSWLHQQVVLDGRELDHPIRVRQQQNWQHSYNCIRLWVLRVLDIGPDPEGDPNITPTQAPSKGAKDAASHREEVVLQGGQLIKQWAEPGWIQQLCACQQVNREVALICGQHMGSAAAQDMHTGALEPQINSSCEYLGEGGGRAHSVPGTG